MAPELSPAKLNLTTRELGIVERVCEGQTRSKIALELGISTRTIDAHLYSIYRKTGVHKNTQLAAWYVKNFPGVKV